MKDSKENNNIIIEAIKQGNVIPFYQPIADNISISDGFLKFEVLARLRVDGELLSPDKFITLSKEFSVYNFITQTVFEKSFQKINSLKDRQDYKRMKFALNIQIDDIKSENTVLFIENLLKKYQIGENLIFELSEENALTDKNETETKKFIKKFRDNYNIQFALDDFGTGYSSFHPLIAFDFDYIKFDQVLIKDIHEDSKKFYLIDMLQEFSERNSLQTVAEYVKDEYHETALKNIGVDFLQGYHYSEPIIEIESLLPEGVK